MAKPFFTLSLSSLCIVLLASSCIAISSERFNECQLESLNALEPDHRVECDGGLIETWNSQHPELKCAGVTVSRRTLHRNALHLPSYSPYPQLILIVQGQGALGLSLPGCPQTYEEPSEQSRRRGRQQQQAEDRHQKIRQFTQGDVLLIPPGVPYWTYNTADEPLVAVSLLDISSSRNQLDQSPRVFYLAGNPDLEHPETKQQQPQPRSAGGRKHGQHQQQEDENKSSSVLSAFGTQFTAQVFGIDEHIAKKIQSPDDETKQIIRVEGGLSVISPKWQDQDQDEDEEQDQPRRHPSRRPSHESQEDDDEDEDEEEERDQPRPHSRRPSHGRREDEDEDEDQPRHHPSRRPSHGRREDEDEDEFCRPIRRPSHGGQGNGVEENICSLKLQENIVRPSRANFYNPRAGRISNVNSLTLPALRQLDLSAQYVVLYKNGIYAPHWNLNANSLIYVTRGQGRVRVVNCQGNSVFNGELRRGQLLVVPQNFVVAEQAGEQGFEYIVFKTNHNAITSYMKDVFRAMPSEVLANAFNLRQSQAHDLKYNGNWGPLVNPDSHQRNHLAGVV